MKTTTTTPNTAKAYRCRTCLHCATIKYLRQRPYNWCSLHDRRIDRFQKAPACFRPVDRYQKPPPC